MSLALLMVIQRVDSGGQHGCRFMVKAFFILREPEAITMGRSGAVPLLPVNIDLAS